MYRTMTHNVDLDNDRKITYDITHTINVANIVSMNTNTTNITSTITIDIAHTLTITQYCY